MKKLLTPILLFTLLALALSGCQAGFPPEEGLPFFAGYVWQDLIGMLFALLFGLIPGFSLFQWLKDKLAVADEAAHWMVLGVSLAITAAAMLFTGAFDLTGFEFTLANILELATYLYVGSQVAYQAFKNGKHPIVQEPE